MKIRIIKFLLSRLSTEEKNQILTEAVKDLFCTISEDDILRVGSRGWVFRGRVQTDAEMKLIASEASMFIKTKLWKVLQLDLKYKANEITFLKSQSAEDLIAGKIWMFSIREMKKRLEKLAKK